MQKKNFPKTVLLYRIESENYTWTLKGEAMRNYELICFNCFAEKKSAEGYCPFCGFNAAVSPNPADALPLGTILHGRYMAGSVVNRASEEIV